MIINIGLLRKQQCLENLFSQMLLNKLMVGVQCIYRCSSPHFASIALLFWDTEAALVTPRLGASSWASSAALTHHPQTGATARFSVKRRLFLVTMSCYMYEVECETSWNSLNNPAV